MKFYIAIDDDRYVYIGYKTTDVVGHRFEYFYSKFSERVIQRHGHCHYNWQYFKKIIPLEYLLSHLLTYKELKQDDEWRQGDFVLSVHDSFTVGIIDKMESHKIFFVNSMQKNGTLKKLWYYHQSSLVNLSSILRNLS